MIALFGLVLFIGATVLAIAELPAEAMPDMVNEFFRATAPVLFANLLTVWFVYTCWAYSKLEREGREGSLEATMRLGAFLLVLSIMLYGLYTYGFMAGSQSAAALHR